jgi:hypothetical protein
MRSRVPKLFGEPACRDLQIRRLVILETSLAKALRRDEPPTVESRRLADQLASMGIGLIPLFPEIEMIEEDMLAQFSGIVPDDEADPRLVELRKLARRRNGLQEARGTAGGSRVNS